MLSNAKGGDKNEFNDLISSEKLKSLDPQMLVNKLKDLFNYKHYAFYYGPRDIKEVATLTAKYHKTGASLKDYPAKTEYPEIETGGKVLFAHFPNPYLKHNSN